MLLIRTPPSTERNLDFFYLHYIREISQVVNKNLCHAIRRWNLTHSCAVSMRLLQMPSRISYSIRLAEFSCKQLCWFPVWASKKLVQFLVASCYSNICSEEVGKAQFTLATPTYSTVSIEYTYYRLIHRQNSFKIASRSARLHSLRNTWRKTGFVIFILKWSALFWPF